MSHSHRLLSELDPNSCTQSVSLIHEAINRLILDQSVGKEDARVLNHANQILVQMLRISEFYQGNAPVVIAKGGFSGLFPDSGLTAYKAAVLTSLTDVILWCDIQLTKDGFGICAPDLLLDNCTDIATAFNGHQKNYPITGVPVNGYFSVDYTLKDLSNLYCKLSL